MYNRSTSKDYSMLHDNNKTDKMGADNVVKWDLRNNDERTETTVREEAAKRRVIDAVAQVGLAEKVGMLEVGEHDFVRITIQSVGGGLNVGKKLYLFDHRPRTLMLGRECDRVEANMDTPVWWDKVLAVKTSLDIDTFADIINQPARVVVMEKVMGNTVAPYVNLYPTEVQSPNVLFGEVSFVAKSGTNFVKIGEDSSYWKWIGESTSRGNACKEIVIVALTDADHRVMAYDTSKADGKTFRTVLGETVSQTALMDR